MASDSETACTEHVNITNPGPPEAPPPPPTTAGPPRPHAHVAQPGEPPTTEEPKLQAPAPLEPPATK